MKKGINIARPLSILALTSWKAVIEYLSHPNFAKSQYEEVRIIRKNKNWEIQSKPTIATKSKPKVLTTQFRGVGLFDLNW